ncbi:BON domain-containing protein [Lampropedia aestuarii]|uniref:BON domain-containing protein n=1 Tax=Lampropedia aestuarii TaxID=2562762 RepID=UPI001F0F53B6|nr:BON domain-containing protein [Lampropedia aestuarii]MDH5858005.1 BON domain-containing protein [Lampropedia aestuarii]
MLSSAGLTACVPLVMGGTAVMTTNVALDRRTAGAQVDDQAIQLKARNSLNQALSEQAHVSINSYNRRVLLTGEVPNEAERQKAAQLTKEVENVREVFNELVIAPASTYSERTQDTWVTSKVRTEILRTSDLPSKSMQVTTERGVVYLQGLVTPREAQLATDSVRSIGGVDKVVRIFEIISEEELQKSLQEREARTAEGPIGGNLGGPNL